MRQRLLPVTVLTSLLVSCETQTNETRPEATADYPPGNFKSGYSDINGLKMYYEIHGVGKPLVLIHGGGSTLESSFGRIIPALAKDRQVIAMELQSHGRTRDIDRPETFEQDADDVAALLKDLKIQKADFLGFSNGGNTTMKIALRHPEVVHKIILASAFFKRDGMYPWFWESIQNATLKDMPALLKEAYRKVAPDPGDLAGMFEKDKARMVGFTDWKEEDIRGIKVPALVVSGDKDVVRPEHAVEMYRLFPDCQLAILPGEHGRYMGEITTLQGHTVGTFPIVPLIKEFLNGHAGE